VECTVHPEKHLDQIVQPDSFESVQQLMIPPDMSKGPLVRDANNKFLRVDVLCQNAPERWKTLGLGNSQGTSQYERAARFSPTRCEPAPNCSDCIIQDEQSFANLPDMQRGLHHPLMRLDLNQALRKFSEGPLACLSTVIRHFGFIVGDFVVQNSVQNEWKTGQNLHKKAQPSGECWILLFSAGKQGFLTVFNPSITRPPKPKVAGSTPAGDI
jgi:hypothetical protein